MGADLLLLLRLCDDMAAAVSKLQVTRNADTFRNLNELAGHLAAQAQRCRKYIVPPYSNAGEVKHG